MQTVFQRTEVMETFRYGEEAEEVLGVPTLGFVPSIGEEKLRLIRDVSTFSPLMEAYRSLRVNLKFATTERPVRSLLVTSSVPAEGKTTTVANLAMAMALSGKCVLVVDADLRRPSLHKVFKSGSTPGLTNLLTGESKLDDVIRPTSVSNVSYIPAGSPPPNPTELLESSAMEQLIAELEERYDVVLFDSPPILAVADAQVLSAQTDGTLLVIGCDETKVRNAQAAMRVLSRARANVVGTVLNRVGVPGGHYYYGKYYVPTAEPNAEKPAEPTPRERVRKERRGGKK